ncbi:MAG: hypothetical protein WDW38_011014 [Sanguina aurantia]
MGFAAGSLVNARGQKLHTVNWVPAAPPKAVVCWAHGYGEYVDRFKGVFPRYMDSQIAVHAMDAHGHGLSEPLTGKDRWIVWNFKDLVDDHVAFVRSIALQYEGQGVPLFLAGNSLGGLITLHAAAQMPGAIAGLVLQGALVDVEWNLTMRMQAPLGGLLAMLMPRAQIVPAVIPEHMSQDKQVVADLLADPMIRHGNVSVRSGNEILKESRLSHCCRPHVGLAPLRVPARTPHPHPTPVPPPPLRRQAVQKLLATVPSTDTQMVIVPGGYHELHMGPEKAEVQAGIVAWILKHSAPAGAQATVPVSMAGKSLGAPAVIVAESSIPDARL